jgi:CDP-glycerol glycerophosphotransferase
MRRFVYNSFHGRFSDNPRAVFEHLQGRPDLEHVWLADRRFAASFPSGTALVDIDGPEARDVLESADVLVANTHTEVDWDKPAGTFYLQTWHGTPLKRIHHDVLWAPEGRLARLDQDVARWDLLLSPNAASTPRLRHGFRYDGPVAETGYPRNDVLTSPGAAELRDDVRRALGVRPGRKVVLYAPTWRDDEFFGTDGTIACALDLEAWGEALGDDHDLLVRFHSMVTERTRLDRWPGVHDVSTYPDIRDLYLAADVLVTDYSSAMFDFAVTGRPQVFYAYDLERFAGAVRGFYFDVLPEAPGPVVQTMAGLVDAVREVDAVAEEYAERRSAFCARYCGLEDGHATERVVELLGLAGRTRHEDRRTGLQGPHELLHPDLARGPGHRPARRPAQHPDAAAP